MKYVAKPVLVDAVVIVGVGAIRSDGAMPLALQDGTNFKADKSLISRYIPQEGDYLVTQQDGYKYINPKDVFERKYAAVPSDEQPNHLKSGVSFSEAVQALKAGCRAQRLGWNGKGMWLSLQTPDAHSKMGHPYIYMSDVAGKLFPWNPNQLDMLAEDWTVGF